MCFFLLFRTTHFSIFQRLLQVRFFFPVLRLFWHVQSSNPAAIWQSGQSLGNPAAIQSGNLLFGLRILTFCPAICENIQHGACHRLL